MAQTDAAVRPLGEALLRPKSVALIGASSDPRKTASRPLQYLRAAGFHGAVYPINPGRETVMGERAWSSLDALPETPEQAFVLTPTDGVAAAVEACGRAGVPVATILANGFAEAGSEGRHREEKLVALAQSHGVRLLGPSSLGLVNLRNGLILTANAAFAESDLPAGGVFAASHSGSMIGALVSRAKARGVGFAGLVSVGGEADLSIGEICAATLDDPQISSYLLFLEGVRHVEQLRRFALGAARRDKPVVAYLLGRSEAARELAQSHTGALAADADVADAFFEDCGVVCVKTFDGMLEAHALLTRMPPRAAAKRSPRVAVVSTTGGGAATVVDQLALRGVVATAPRPETQERLVEATGLDLPRNRIVDLTLAGTRYEVMKAALDTLLDAPEFDLVVAVAGSSARFHPDLAVKPIIDSVDGERPLAAFIVPDAPEAVALLTVAGAPCFRTPESCADVVAAALSRRRPRERAPAQPRPESALRAIDEQVSYRLLEALGVEAAPHVEIALDGSMPEGLRFPVVVKALTAELAHKSDVGGVVLNVGSPAEARDAVAEIRRSVSEKKPGVAVDRFLAQTMVRGLGEVLLGYRIDRNVGPIVMLAAGGILAEILNDRAVRLAPATLGDAREMIAEVRSLRALEGYRGKPKGDLDALARAIVAMSQLAEAAPEVVEAEVNPLMVLREGEGVVAVDAVCWVA